MIYILKYIQIENSILILHNMKLFAVFKNK